MLEFHIIIILILCIAYYFYNKKINDNAEEYKKEKENYKILSERYYYFCEKNFKETQKLLVESHVYYNIGVSNYEQYLDELREIKGAFYKTIEVERDRYIQGEIEDAVKFKYRTKEHSLYDKKIEDICSMFISLLHYA